MHNGYPTDRSIQLCDLDVGLSGGEFDDSYEYYDNCVYRTKDFVYYFIIVPGEGNIQIDNVDLYSHAKLEMYFSENNGEENTCYTNLVSKGKYICKSLEPFGWITRDDTF